MQIGVNPNINTGQITSFQKGWGASKEENEKPVKEFSDTPHKASKEMMKKP